MFERCSSLTSRSLGVLGQHICIQIFSSIHFLDCGCLPPPLLSAGRLRFCFLSLFLTSVLIVLNTFEAPLVRSWETGASMIVSGSLLATSATVSTTTSVFVCTDSSSVAFFASWASFANCAVAADFARKSARRSSLFDGFFISDLGAGFGCGEG